MAEEVFVFPQSFAQQRLWFLDQMVPGNSFYNVHDAIYFTTPLHLSALKVSLNEIVRRHEVLRTTFANLDGYPVQVVNPSLELPLPFVDLSHLPADAREDEAARLSAEEAERSFDLTNGPLVRATLLRMNADEHVLLLTLHHIVSDGWSLEVFIKELSALYESFSMGQPSPLPELPIQYADFAVWQREWLRGEVLEEQLAYWRQQLADAPTTLELPTDHPRPPVQTFRGATQSLELSTQLTASLKALSQQQGATLFMTLLAAFKTLLYRYSGQRDIVVGSPIAGRNRAELDDLIGFFVNTLVLRTRLSDDLSFCDLLHRVRESALGAYAHQDLPFEKLVEELHPERDTSRNPLFQVVFALQNISRDTLSAQPEEPALDNSNSQQGHAERGTAKFDLSLALQETESGLSGVIEYSTDLFDDETISRMIGHFERLLESITADPQKRLSALQLLTDEEQHRLLFDWNDVKTDYPRDFCIHRLFEAQVERSPEAVAVNYADAQLTYAELNAKANQLARRLRKMGVGPEVIVGVCMQRSALMIVALLGILKAGGVYMPLDPEHPVGRLSFMLQDSDAPVLLTQEKLTGVLPLGDARVFRVDAEWETIAQESIENIESSMTAEHLAYVLYTSGSTGKPKGVAIPHRAISRLVCNTNYIELGSSDTLSQTSNASFDAAIFEIWAALLHGAQLVGISKDVALSPERLAAEIREKKINTLFLTTALFNQLASEAPGIFNSLRYLLFGGEAVDPKWVREALSVGRPEHILHFYGPTESTTFATWYLVEDVAPEATNIPIGRAVSNTEIYILSDTLEPVPIGVSGEIYIGGDGLARGYLRQPSLTAEKFIPHPYSREPGARLYRTGDVGRYLANGQIEFLGRRDQQIKIRGFRIELGEIESVLNQHPSIRDTVVVAREETTGDRRLVAYVVPVADEEAASAGELRRYLKENLPDYMVPSSFVRLEQMPLTPNGKVDRRALPEPSQIEVERDACYVAPQTEIEREIAAIWQATLGVEHVGLDDNFFDLGGHSLLLIRVHKKLTEVVGRDVAIVELFRHPTVRALAGHLGQESYLKGVEDTLELVQLRAEKQRRAILRHQQLKEGAR
ncbi:MAG TPA: amino acid adenylation domain-containing protein [Pyrinomonadaceae bacterium]|jgi:amino acid adenylation domain-containing protein